MANPVYKPTVADLQWARNLVAVCRDGAIIKYPKTSMIYRVDHKDRTLTLQNVDQLLSFPSFVIHYQTIDVFREIGYTVYPPKDEEHTA